MMVVGDPHGVRSVADPCPAYESMRKIWRRSKAICGGELAAKRFDQKLDTIEFSNLLVPFSTKMTQVQYNFFLSEAELPGVTREFARMLVGGLLRKQPIIKTNAPQELIDWINDEFGADGSPLISFLDEALWEEMQTSRAWVKLDYPSVDGPDAYPYPTLLKAESVINWSTKEVDGVMILNRVVTSEWIEEFEDSGAYEFHPRVRLKICVHELDKEGNYQVREYLESAQSTPEEIAGQKQNASTAPQMTLNKTFDNITCKGVRLRMIPLWPLNGSIECQMPLLQAFVDKEVALYNKTSRRNHLLYGASTYTPYVKGAISEEEFSNVVDAGLGAWLRVFSDDGSKVDVGVLETPTQALADMDRAIKDAYEELARLGIRILAPEEAQSGVALQIRNASQTTRLANMATRINGVVAQIIQFMIYWKTGTLYDVDFQLSEDFDPTPLGQDWLRLVTEWYQANLIPRSVWVNFLQRNEMLPKDYDDKRGAQEILQGLEDTMAQNKDAAGAAAIDG